MQFPLFSFLQVATLRWNEKLLRTESLRSGHLLSGCVSFAVITTRLLSCTNTVSIKLL